MNPESAESSHAGARLAHMRNDYVQGELDERNMPDDPFVQFEGWFQEACAAGVIEPNAISLATASPTGQTTLRTVLCKGYDRDGFLFFTNLESTKATQIAANPNVSLLFPWLKLERQVIVNGSAGGGAQVLHHPPVQEPGRRVDLEAKQRDHHAQAVGDEVRGNGAQVCERGSAAAVLLGRVSRPAAHD